MALTRTRDVAEPVVHGVEGDGIVRHGVPCFYCAEPVVGWVVYWHGCDPAGELLGDAPVLVLHPDCATQLCIRLLRDVHQWQHADAPDFAGFARTAPASDAPRSLPSSPLARRRR